MEGEEESSKKPCYDPGWNDPPTFSYSSHTSHVKTEKRGNVLNKRVAFPLQNNSGLDKKLPSIDPTLPPKLCDLATLPPPPSVSSMPVVDTPVSPMPVVDTPVSPNCEDEKEILNFNDEESLKTVLDNFNDVLKKESESEELKEKADDIRKRLNVIKKMWEDNKFNFTVKQKILQLSEAVKSGNAEKADHLQKCLMVDHVSLCSPWMAGVRYIVNSLHQ